MELKRLSERIWYLPFEKERDRPNLIYIRGDRWSLAVDAGHSELHTRAFYKAVEAAGLALPKLTVLTHWHWDHTLGMHEINGLSLANRMTDGHLRELRKKLREEGREAILSMDESIRLEYAPGQNMKVTLPDMLFQEEMRLDAGNCPVRLFQAEAPHTDDSTLVHVENEKVLILGDAAGGRWPTWEKDPALAGKLAQTILSTDAQICLESHWTPETPQETAESLLSDE